MIASMHARKAHVENGRIVVDEPTNLPDGTSLTVVVTDDTFDERVDGPPHELTDDERRIQLSMPWIHFARHSGPPLTVLENEELDRSLGQVDRGDVVPHDQVMHELGLV
jgi:hypothetical protein